MDEGLLCLKWNNHDSTFTNALTNLRKQEIFTDATIACEGVFFPVHKFVLSTCSDYFKEVFQRTTCTSPVIILKDITAQEIEFILDYMYIGEVDVQHNDLASLVKAAECLQVKGLAVPERFPVMESTKRNQPEEVLPSVKRVKRNVPKSIVIKEASVSLPQIVSYRKSEDHKYSLVSLKKVKLNETDTPETIENETESIHVAEDNQNFVSHEEIIEDIEHIVKEEICGSNAGPSGIKEEIIMPQGNVIIEDTGSPQVLVRNDDGSMGEIINNSDFSDGAIHVESAAVTDIPHFACLKCPHKALNPAHMRRHMRTHTKEKPYACSLCPFKSAQLSNVKSHLRTHTGEKPYKCTYCSFKTARSDNIRRHLLTHTYSSS